MNFLRQSTAVDIAIGPFLDSTDGVTAETGLTISQADVRLKKNNGAWAQVNDNTSATHEENGWYEKELDATDTNTVGILIIAVHESGALPVWHEFTVLEEAVYDALFAASAPGYLQPTTAGRTLDVSAGGEAGIDWANVGSPTTTVGLSGTTVKTATDVETDTADIQTRLPAALVSGRIDASVGAMAANTMTASALAADAVTEIQSGLSTLDAAGVRTAVGLASANLDTQFDAIPTAVENADTMLNRDMSTGTDSGSATVRTVRQALRFLRNKFSISGGTITVYKEDDSTASWTGAVTTASGNPVTEIDPASS